MPKVEIRLSLDYFHNPAENTPAQEARRRRAIIIELRDAYVSLAEDVNCVDHELLAHVESLLRV